MVEVTVELRVKLGVLETAEKVTMRAPDGQELEYARRIIEDLRKRAEARDYHLVAD